MKIVVLGLRGFPDVQGGVEKHCEELFTRVAARGHEVVVLARTPYMPAARTQHKGVRLVALPCPRRKSLEAFLHTLLGVFHARGLKPDIVHIHAIGPSLMAPVARLLGMKVVTTNHGADYERKKWGRMARTVLRLGEYCAARYSNAVVAISEPIAENLRNCYGTAAVVIPNGVVIPRPSTQTDAIREYGLERNRYVLAVSRLVPEKGLHDLLDAFARAQLSDWKLVIAGKADHEDAYSLDLMRRATAVPATVMTGFVTGEPLAQLYSHAGLFVLPSYHEGLPIALLEAMSYGLPVLASDIRANRIAGLAEDRFFPPGNPARCAEMMREHAARDFIAARDRAQVELVARRFDWNSIADRTVSLYEATMRGSGTPLRESSPRQG